MIHFLSWLAVLMLATGQAAQICRIHVHKEVRDLSPWMFIFWIIGCFILLLESLAVGSAVFAFKNVLMMGLMGTILFQIWYHRKDHWHDDDDPHCVECHQELELDWLACPYCGTQKMTAE